MFTIRAVYERKEKPVKGKMHEMKLEKIIERACELSGAKNEAQLCKKMGITQSSFGNRKRRGTAQELIFSWALQSNYDLNYMFQGIRKENELEENKVIQEIASWVKENSLKNESFKFWFLYELEQKFPEFKEWRKRKETLDNKGTLDLFNPISQNNSK